MFDSIRGRDCVSVRSSYSLLEISELFVLYLREASRSSPRGVIYRMYVCFCILEGYIMLSVCERPGGVCPLH